MKFHHMNDKNDSNTTCILQEPYSMFDLGIKQDIINFNPQSYRF